MTQNSSKDGLYGKFIDHNIIDRATADFLWENKFYSAEALCELPIEKPEELQKLLKGCPGIEKPGLLMSLNSMILNLRSRGTIWIV